MGSRPVAPHPVDPRLVDSHPVDNNPVDNNPVGSHPVRNRPGGARDFGAPRVSRALIAGYRRPCKRGGPGNRRPARRTTVDLPPDATGW